MRDTLCNSVEESSTFTVYLDGIWREFETLGDIKPQATRKAAPLLGIEEALPSIFEQLIARPDVGYEDIKRATIASTKHMGIGVGTEQTHGTVAYKTTARSAGHERKPKANRCAYCLKRNHRWRQCDSYLGRKPPVNRLKGMERARDFPPPPFRSERDEESISDFFFGCGVTQQR